MDKLFCDLNKVTGRHKESSVHLVLFPKFDVSLIDHALEERMNIAQNVSSMVLGLRRKVSIKVRQPLNKLMIPLLEKGFKEKFEAVKALILSEVNVKEVEYINDTAGILIKKIKPNFKTLGPKYGKLMKEIAAEVLAMKQEDILKFEKEGSFSITAGTQALLLVPEDVEIISEDIPGWLVANEGKITVALDINMNEELRQEGIAREFVNRIQNLRKDSGFDVTDKILIEIQKHDSINEAIGNFKDYIASQTLAKSIVLVDLVDGDGKEVEIDEEIKTRLKIEKQK
jgi:isoleucyl-tRNA synthetase